jgi:hypothetical protein
LERRRGETLSEDEQGPQQQYDAELPDFDAEVEAEQRRDESLAWEGQLDEDAREAEAVYQSEGEGEKNA